MRNRSGAVILLALWACKAPPTETIVLGGILDETGPISSPGWPPAAALAISDLNAGLVEAGSNIRFKLVTADSISDPTTATTRGTALVQQQGAKGLVTDTSSDQLGLLSLAYGADASNPTGLGVPIICMDCTSPSLNDPTATNANAVTQAAYQDANGWSFRTIQDNLALVGGLLNIVLAKGTNGDVNNDGQLKVSVLIDNNSGGTAFESTIQSMAPSRHPTPAPILNVIDLPATFDINTYDFSTTVNQLLGNQTNGVTDFYPDAVMVNDNVNQTAPVLQIYSTFQPVNLKAQFYNTQTLRFQNIVEQLGVLLNGQEGMSPVLFTPDASGSVFDTEFRAAAGIPEGVADSGVYDAFVLLGLASLSKAVGMTHPATELTGTDIRDSLRAVNDPSGEVVRTGPAEIDKAYGLLKAGKKINYEGASGPCDFDANGNVRHLVEHYQGQNGQFVGLERYNCIGAPDPTNCPLYEP